MGLGDFWLQFNNGKKENLSDIKGDIRRETVNKKYQKIFDFFDTNKNGAIEGKEAEKFIEVISKFAGEDKILTKTEAASIFSEIGIKTSDGIDFVGFVQELSEANKKIKTSEESSLPDGSRKVVTNYTNGARFTAVYYPDGELKYTIKELPAKGTSVTNSVNNIVEAGPVIDDPSVNPTLRTVRKVEFSERAKSELRQNFGGHFEETASNILSLIEPFLSDMTVWDRAGIDMRQAFVNGDLTDMFTAEGVKKLEEFLAKAKDDKELGQKLVEMAQNQVGTFEFHLEKDFGIKDFDFEKMENFHQTSTKYMNAKSLKQRVELLNKGLKEVKQLYQNALTKKKGVPNSDKLNSDYDKKFMEVLTEYFNGDEGVAAAFFNTMKEGLATGTKNENEENDVLITILERIQQATSQTLIDSLQGEKFENLEGRYKSEFKDIYGVEDNTTEVENIIQTGQEIGGTIKIGAMTTIQILLSALTMGTGNAALIATMSNPLVSYLTTIGTDYALSVAGALSSVNGLTAEKHDRILESTVETAKFIGVGSLSAPLCRFVGNTMAKYTGKLFENGVKTTTGNVTATVVTGENFLQKICSKSANFTGSFGTELGVFTGYEVVTQDEDFDEAAGSQTTMLSQLKVINKFLQTALGKFVQTQSAKGQQKLAEQQYQKFLQSTGLDKAIITQYETPTGTRYAGEINGIKFTGATEAEIQAKLLYVAAQGIKVDGNKEVNEGVKVERVHSREVKAVSLDDVKQMYDNKSIKRNRQSERLYQESQMTKGVIGYSYLFDYALDDIDYKNIYKMMNVCNGKFAHLYNKNTIEGRKLIQQIALLAKNARRCEDIDIYVMLGENEWNVIIDALKNRSDKEIDILDYYKMHTWDIGNAISNRGKISEETRKVIAQLTEYLDMQSLVQTITVSRGELYDGCLNNIRTNDGLSTIANRLKELATSASEAEQEAFVRQELVGRSVIQDHIMSTSLDKKLGEAFAGVDLFTKKSDEGGILFNITAEKGSKGVFIEDLNGFHGGESEVLFQRNTKLIITNAQFDKEKNIWIVDAKIDVNGNKLKQKNIDYNVLKPDLTKAKVENSEVIKGQNGFINLSDEVGNLLGFVNYNIVEKDGKKYLKFEGLKSNVQGHGVGTKLIQELIKTSEQLGAEGRLIASASPMTNKAGKVTNIEFYYKLGFKAVDPAKDAEICSYIEKGEPVPVRLNVFTEIEFKLDEHNSLIDGKYSRPLTEYDKIGNKVFELKSKDVTENPEKIAELKAEIEVLRKTEPKQADELQIVLDMFTNPTSVHNVTDAQIDAVVNYLNSHYDNVEKYLTKQSGEIGISGENLGRFGHRIKGEWSTRDKIANYINDSIKKEQKAKEKGQAFTPRTLLDAYQDVRDKYACRTVFKNGNYANHPEIVKILEEGNYSDAAYRKAQLRAAEIQSQPAVDMLKEAMRKAVREGKDLSMMRISNYTSEGGIPIFSEAQLAELKDCGIELGIDVSFIKLASEKDPNTTKMIVDGATTKAQPSGYTALQVNFITKAGEIMEWQYRGERVNKFAEAEHLPYDIRTGKHPWRQYPELETLYKPIADLLVEKNMPKYAYDQLNRYFTDYYNHLRKLELGFESKEPKLEDYEHWKAKDKDGVEREYTFRFDKRLSAKNLEALHFYGEGIKDGAIAPERALKEYNAEVKYGSKDLPKPEVKAEKQSDRTPEVMNILNSREGLKNIREDIKTQIAGFVGKSKPENQEEIVKLIYKLKNAKERWGEKTQEYTDEQLLQIISVASNPDGTLNLTVLQRICKRMDGGPREDNSKMTRILPMDTKEHNLTRKSDGFYDEDLVEIGQKLMYAHKTREEIFRLLKDENG